MTRYTYDRRTDSALIRALGGTLATRSVESTFNGGPDDFRLLATHCLGTAMTADSAATGLAALDQADASSDELLKAVEEMRRSGIPVPEWFLAEGLR